MRFVVDRRTGRYVILESEGGDMVKVPKCVLPEETKEGDVFLYDGTSYVYSEELTKQTKEDVQSILDELWE